MAHDTHAADHGATHHSISNENKTSKTALSSSFWFVIILVGLFIASVNFIGAMSGDEHGEKEGAAQHTMEASSNGTLHGETGLGKPADDTTQHHSAVEGQGSESSTGAAEGGH